MASQIVAYKLAAYFLGKQGFSEYALARRTVTLILPVTVLGMSVGLPRYIGFSNGRGDREAADRYFGATLWCAGGAAIVCLVLINLFPGLFSYLFFGSKSYRSLALPLSLMIVGLCEHAVACGYFRGHLQLNRANLLQFTNLAALPIVVLFLVHKSLSIALTFFGVVWIATSSLALSFTPLRTLSEKSGTEVRQLFSYGIQRVPGDFFLMALFTLPATIGAHLYGVERAGYVAFGLSLVAMIGGVFAPVGLVLLPKATTMLAEGAYGNLRAHVKSILRIAVAASLTIVVFAWTALPSAIHIYLGPEYEEVAPIARVLLFAALPYCVYLVVRNLVDAYHEYGVTAAILAVGLAAFLAGTYFGRHLFADIRLLLAAFVVSMLIIAGLSSWECTRILRVRSSQSN